MTGEFQIKDGTTVGLTNGLLLALQNQTALGQALTVDTDSTVPFQPQAIREKPDSFSNTVNKGVIFYKDLVAQVAPVTAPVQDAAVVVPQVTTDAPQRQWDITVVSSTSTSIEEGFSPNRLKVKPAYMDAYKKHAQGATNNQPVVESPAVEQPMVEPVAVEPAPVVEPTLEPTPETVEAVPQPATPVENSMPVEPEVSAVVEEPVAQPNPEPDLPLPTDEELEALVNQGKKDIEAIAKDKKALNRMTEERDEAQKVIDEKLAEQEAARHTIAESKQRFDATKRLIRDLLKVIQSQREEVGNNMGKVAAERDEVVNRKEETIAATQELGAEADSWTKRAAELENTRSSLSQLLSDIQDSTYSATESAVEEPVKGRIAA